MSNDNDSISICNSNSNKVKEANDDYNEYCTKCEMRHHKEYRICDLCLECRDWVYSNNGDLTTVPQQYHIPSGGIMIAGGGTYYYDYGFTKREFKICINCLNNNIRLKEFFANAIASNDCCELPADSTNVDSGFIFGKYRTFFPEVFSKAYESICQVIKDYTVLTTTMTARTINYYEAVRIAYGLSKQLRVYLDIKDNDIWEKNR